VVAYINEFVYNKTKNFIDEGYRDKDFEVISSESKKV